MRVSFFFQAEDGIRDADVTGVQTCALPILERVHGDLDALMHARDVDAVYIALPNALHHAAVLAAARGQKPVLCEKPFAMTVAQAREMVDACRAAGVLLRIAHQIRLDAAIGRARE